MLDTVVTSIVSSSKKDNLTTPVIKTSKIPPNTVSGVDVSISSYHSYVPTYHSPQQTPILCIVLLQSIRHKCTHMNDNTTAQMGKNLFTGLFVLSLCSLFVLNLIVFFWDSRRLRLCTHVHTSPHFSVHEQRTLLYPNRDYRTDSGDTEISDPWVIGGHVSVGFIKSRSLWRIPLTFGHFGRFGGGGVLTPFI